MVSAGGGASLGVRCLEEGCAGGRGWASFTPAGNVTVLHPGVHEGVVMTVLHEVTGAVLLTKTFNTWHRYSHALDLVWWAGRLRAGRVVVVVVRGAGTYGLGDALPALTSLGSVLVQHAPPRALLAWAFVVGGRTLLETLAPNHWSSNVTLHAYFLLPAAHAVPLFSAGLVPASQERLCDSQAALGSLCDPVAPLVMPVSVGGAQWKKKIGQEEIGQEEIGQEEVGVEEVGVEEEVGVVVCAGGRFQYLAHTLVRLLHNPGLDPRRIVVVLNGSPPPEVLQLVELLGVQHSVVDVPLGVASINDRLFQFYRLAWGVGVTTFPRARYLAFLDEDVEVSSDWLSLLLHLAPALTLDASLWCVSGSGSPHPSQHQDPRRVVREARQPGWGFLVLASEARAVVQSWPDTPEVSPLYDIFLLTSVGRGRECVFPMVGRSKHYGLGVNTEPEIHYYYFLRLPLHDGSPAALPPPEALTHTQYEAQVWARLRAATPLIRNPCVPGFLAAPDDGSITDLMFFFFMDNLKDSLEWALLGECVGAWPYSTQAMHQGSLELPQAWGGSVWVVGVPASPYHTLRPSGVPVWRPTTNEQLEQQMQYFSSLRPIPNLTDRTLDAVLTHLFLPVSLPGGASTVTASPQPPHFTTSSLQGLELTSTTLIDQTNNTNTDNSDMNRTVTQGNSR